jgi:putative phosphoesterase
MKILAFTDFHGNQQAYRKACDAIANEQPDLVIVAGDLVNHDAEKAKEYLSFLASAGRPVYFVPGNMDNPQLNSWPGTANVRALHGRCETFEGITLVGLGDSPNGPFVTPNEFDEDGAAALLTQATQSNSEGAMILVSHCPPKNTKLDLTFDGEHAGSSSVRRYVEQVHPTLVISGHIHEAQGTEKLGESTLVNTGPAQRGNYATIILNGNASVIFRKLI